MKHFATLRTKPIKSFEELNDAVAGADRQVIQIEGGKLVGQLSHGTIGGLPIDTATFNRGLRSRGRSHRDRVSIGMVTGCQNRVTRSSYETLPGDVLITPPGGENEHRYYGGASFVVISLSFAEIESMFGPDSWLGDPTAWRGNQFKGSHDMVGTVIPLLQTLLARLGKSDALVTVQAAEFWKRAVIEAMTASIVAGTPSERDGPLPSTLRVVRQVEDYLAMQDAGPIHISQICSQLRVSRRTLHRAFHEALGIGPIAFLRHRRLCAAHTALRSNPQDGATITDLALQHGFLHLGRFAHYYRQQFGEYPSQTRQVVGTRPSARPGA